MSEFRYHPEIEGLKTNENGSQVLLNEKPQEVKVRKSGKNPYRYIYYRGNVISLARLVLECWVGMPPEPKLTARFKDGNYSNYHHTNLDWGNWGGNSKYPPKLTPDLEKEILQKSAEGVSDCELARQYDVARNTIQKLKKRIANKTAK